MLKLKKIPLENTTLKLNNNSKITTRKYNTEAELELKTPTRKHNVEAEL
jgi:hypothetical protein